MAIWSHVHYVLLHVVILHLKDSDDDLKDLELQGLILSSEYWPGFREENLELPGAIQKSVCTPCLLLSTLYSMHIWKLCLAPESTLQYRCYLYHRKIENYSQEYQKLKGMRKLQWKAYLGMVDVSMCCDSICPQV